MINTLLLLFACSEADKSYEIQVGGEGEATDTSIDSEEIVEEQTGESLYNDFCSSCHGQDGTGGSHAPGVINHLNDTDDELLDIIINGFGRMEGIPLSEDEAMLIIAYMKNEFED